MDKYICKECGLEVTIDSEGNVIRNCDHTGTIILELNVEVFGESKVE